MKNMQDQLGRLQKRYAGNAAVLAKMSTYISEQLPDFLEAYAGRLQRKETLEAESESYIHGFLNDPKRQYFYIPNSEVFVQYDGEHYAVANESDILHIILSEISSNKSLVPWKHKVTKIVMARVKEQSILQALPESATIQAVINRFSQVLFRRREQAKYFLTVMGDSLLRRHPKLVHLVSPTSKALIRALRDTAYTYFKNGCRLDNTFKFKYHGHEYKMCRILNFDKAAAVEDCWWNFIRSHVLDVIVVAAHYSRRFGGGDRYLTDHNHDEGVRQEVLYLKARDEAEVVLDFVTKSIVRTPDALGGLAWEDMYFLWKVYLSERNLPSLLFIKDLRSALGKCLSYDSDAERYIGVTSPHMVEISRIKRFWDATVFASDDDEFEVSELHTLFIAWVSGSQEQTTVDAARLLDVITYFYKPEVIGSKTVRGIGSSVWDKRGGMQSALDHIRLKYAHEDRSTSVSFHCLYKVYCKIALDASANTVSKHYFEKYIDQVVPKKYITGQKLKAEYWQFSGAAN
jgi:hypothetical protein